MHADTQLSLHSHERRGPVRPSVRPNPRGHKLSTRRQFAGSLIRDRLNLRPRLDKPVRTDQALSVGTSMGGASVKAANGGTDLLLTGTRLTFTTKTFSSRLTSYQPPTAQLRALPPRQTGPGSATSRSARSQIRWSAPTTASAHYRLCLNPTHRAGDRPILGDDQRHQILLAARGVNFQKNCVTSARGRTSVHYEGLTSPK